MHRARRRTIPTLPKTSEDIIEKLRKFETFTCKREGFLLHAEMLSGKPFVIFTCRSNLQHKADAVTERSSTVLDSFTIYTLHGYFNETFVPLVFALLPNKTRRMAITNGTCVSFCNQPKAHYLATSKESRRYVVAVLRVQAFGYVKRV